jgi:hypothetical protein
LTREETIALAKDVINELTLDDKIAVLGEVLTKEEKDELAAQWETTTSE